MIEHRKPVHAHDWTDSKYLATFLVLEGGPLLAWTPTFVDTETLRWYSQEELETMRSQFLDVHCINRCGEKGEHATPADNIKWNDHCPEMAVSMYVRYGSEDHEYYSGLDINIVNRRLTGNSRNIACVEVAIRAHAMLYATLARGMRDGVPDLFVATPLPDNM